MTLDNSRIEVDAAGNVTAYVGAVATKLVQAKVCMVALKARANGLQVARNATPTNLLRIAESVIGLPKPYYTKNKKGMLAAAEDLRV